MNAASYLQSIDRLALAFNLLPSLELHPDQISKFVQPAVWDRLATQRSGHRHLSRHILKTEDLEGKWVTSFATTSRRLALLSYTSLDRLSFLLGVVLNAEWIATRIHRNEVSRVRDGLGRQHYAFATGQARFLGGPLDWPPPKDDQPIDQWLQDSGDRCLSSVIEEEPAELVRRYRLRRPPDRSLASSGSDAPKIAPAKAIVLCRKIAREIGPECASLLA
ncbi:MAG: SctK family type III secretion system sorting platform protein [Pseudomonadota bacterium]